MKEFLEKMGPVFLVFGAWLFTFIAIFRPGSGETLVLPMIVVMDIIMAVFYLKTEEKMKGKVLKQWRQVLLIGLISNLIGTAGFLHQGNYSELMIKTALYSWMMLPGLGYLQTWENITEDRKIYLGCGLATIAGFLIFALVPETLLAGSKFIGLSLVWIGQTAGIAYAARKNIQN